MRPPEQRQPGKTLRAARFAGEFAPHECLPIARANTFTLDAGCFLLVRGLFTRVRHQSTTSPPDREVELDLLEPGQPRCPSVPRVCIRTTYPLIVRSAKGDGQHTLPRVHCRTLPQAPCLNLDIDAVGQTVPSIAYATTVRALAIHGSDAHAVSGQMPNRSVHFSKPSCRSATRPMRKMTNKKETHSRFAKCKSGSTIAASNARVAVFLRMAISLLSCLYSGTPPHD